MRIEVTASKILMEDVRPEDVIEVYAIDDSIRVTIGLGGDDDDDGDDDCPYCEPSSYDVTIGPGPFMGRG